MTKDEYRDMKQFERLSNFELLRVVCMFMVLFLHANFVALGKPSFEELGSSTHIVGFRWFLEVICIPSVNAFVLISGWFGIKASLKSTLRFIYQILFVLGGVFVVTLLLRGLESPLHSLADVLQLTPYDWFIKSYFVLMIMSPLLNQFKDLALPTQKFILLPFFAFEAIYGWIAGGARFFVDGYGPLHLIGIYLLGQYLHFSLPKEKGQGGFSRCMTKLFNLKTYWNILVFGVITIIIAIMGLADLKLLGGKWSNSILAYDSPFVVMASVFLFLSFARMDIKYSKVINWLGASSFAAYLFHGSPIIRKSLFNPIIQSFYEHQPGFIAFVYISAFLVVVYLVACLLDQARLFSWRILSVRLFKR